jgi:hypothetical protein
VGDEATPLNGKDKLLRCPLVPAFEYLFFKEAVKGYVQLHRGKVIRVEFKPFFLGKVRGIERPVPPMRIVVAARPDENHL